MHVVAPFVAPLLDDPQSSGVELYCYSAHPGEADGFQRYAAGQATGAQLIAKTPGGQFVKPLDGGWKKK